MAMRHEHIVDLVAAIEARLVALCPSLAFVGRSQATSYKDLAKLIPQLAKLPAAVVVLGPIDSDQEQSSRGARPRTVDVGVLLVGEYNANQDEGAPNHWAILDEVHDGFTPAVSRGEKTGLPVAVLGDQDGPTRGTLLVPAGYRAMTEIPGRSCGVYNLLAVDTMAERTGLPADPADPAAPETGVAALQDLDRVTLWLSPSWQRRFITGSQIREWLQIRERRHAWVSPYSYCGTAPSGSAESAAAWTIARIEVASDGSTTVLHAVDVKWDDRLTAGYA